MSSTSSGVSLVAEGVGIIWGVDGVVIFLVGLFVGGAFVRVL